jgi:hypothetical protein
MSSFHEARGKTNGGDPEVLAKYRDPHKELEVVNDLRQLMTQILQRPPTIEEMEAGPPPGEALEALDTPQDVYDALVGGGFVLSEAYDYLREQEVKAQRELSGERELPPWLLPAAVLSALGATGWWAYNRYRSG